MKTNLRNYKFAMFSALVMSMIIPFAGISMAQATPTNVDPYHIGTVADGTYNETAALQRVTQLMNTYHEKTQEKQNLEQSLKTALPGDVQTINDQISTIQGQRDQIMQEFNGIQAENLKLYYIDPTLLQKYQAASDNFVDQIQNQYWNGKSTFEDKKNAFPLVEIGVNGKTKSVEITLPKDIENSAKADQYVSIIRNLMPKDVPWTVTYGKYPIAYSCTSRTVACSPLIGGIQTATKFNATFNNYCTLGFDAKRTSDNAAGFVFAGHCENGLTGNPVYQPDTGTTVGTASTYVYSSGTDCDCGWVKLSNGITINDKVFHTGSSTYTILNVTAQSHQPAGKFIQMSGVASGIATGSVSMNDVMITIDGVSFNHQVKASLTAAKGDSGAPITNSTDTSLFGEVIGGSGSTTYYSPEDRVAADLGVTIITG